MFSIIASMSKQNRHIAAFLKQIRLPFVLLLTVMILGSFGYHFLWREYESSWLESVFMTFITVTTIGYGQIHPLNNGGKLLTIFISVMGIGSLFYLLSSVMEFLVARGLSDPSGRRKMRTKIANLKNHVIVAGYGRMGQRIVEELRQEKIDFVVIDKESGFEELCQSRGYLYIRGDAEEDEVLQRAGISEAKSLIAATGSDAENAFIAMSVKALNPKVFVVARADDDSAIRKLKKAGADRVVNPYAIAGQRMVNTVLRPVALDFMSTTLSSAKSPLGIQEFHVPAGSPFANKTLQELELRKRCGVNVAAIVRDGRDITNPEPDLIIEPADHMIILGTEEQFDKLRAMTKEALAEAGD